MPAATAPLALISDLSVSTAKVAGPVFDVPGIGHVDVFSLGVESHVSVRS